MPSDVLLTLFMLVVPFLHLFFEISNELSILPTARSFAETLRKSYVLNKSLDIAGGWWRMGNPWLNAFVLTSLWMQRMNFYLILQNQILFWLNLIAFFKRTNLLVFIINLFCVGQLFDLITGFLVACRERGSLPQPDTETELEGMILYTLHFNIVIEYS